MIATAQKSTSFPVLAAEIAATLRKLGYRVQVKHYATDEEYFEALFNDWRNIDVGISGWISDYPAPGNFFSALSCAAGAYTCTPALDRRIAGAAAAAASGSNNPWTRLDREVATGAFVVPMFNPKAIEFVSRRLRNYQHHPVFGLLLDQVWVQ
jgi:peptide/nickel transport system substrate-binding protein